MYSHSHFDSGYGFLVERLVKQYLQKRWIGGYIFVKKTPICFVILTSFSLYAHYGTSVFPLDNTGYRAARIGNDTLANRCWQIHWGWGRQEHFREPAFKAISQQPSWSVPRAFAVFPMQLRLEGGHYIFKGFISGSLEQKTNTAFYFEWHHCPYMHGV